MSIINKELEVKLSESTKTYKEKIEQKDIIINNYEKQLLSLKNDLEKTLSSKESYEKMINELSDTFKQLKESGSNETKRLIEEVEKYRNSVNAFNNDYENKMVFINIII